MKLEQLFRFKTFVSLLLVAITAWVFETVCYMYEYSQGLFVGGGLGLFTFIIGLVYKYFFQKKEDIVKV